MLSRRSFLARSALAAAPLLLPRNFLNAAAPPNSLLNLAVLGLGKMGDGHIGAFSGDPRVRIRAVCDVDNERVAHQRQRVAKRYQCAVSDIAGYRDFREVLAREDIDAVVIATPNHWHAIMAILAARAGKHIYCEKPLTFTVEEGEAVARAVRAAGVVFQTGSQQRSNAIFRQAVVIARSGAIGEIRDVWCNIGRRYPVARNWPAEPVRPGVDWDLWLGPRPPRPFSSKMCPPLIGGTPPKPYGYAGMAQWHYYIEYGNGMSANWGAHHFDIAQWGLGYDGKGPRFVEVFPDKNNTPNDVASNDLCHVRYTYSNGVKLHVGFPETLKPQVAGANQVLFEGTEGAVSVARGDRIWVSRPSLRRVGMPEGRESIYSSNNHRDNFIEGILTGRPTIAPVGIGQSSCNTCLIGNIAHLLGENLEYDWRTQKFVQNPRADRLLRRENRAPWNAI
jgi:predicted dehydrogenase